MTDYLRSMAAYVATRHYPTGQTTNRPGQLGQPAKAQPSDTVTPADSPGETVDTPTGEGRSS